MLDKLKEKWSNFKDFVERKWTEYKEKLYRSYDR
jgi:hypothetical protein